ncbi:MAG TPA: class I SAM-dependent methyltransferase [Nitrosopumilaceae archaeon]|nr:class I SAM-dependent methyltransferase [Nitrosopumilaceae archaeon]
MKIEEYLASLPQSILSGQEVQLPDNAFREIFRFAELGKNDIFYHLGCGNGRGVSIALEEFDVKKAVGIDIDKKKISLAEKFLQEKNLSNFTLQCGDISDADFSDATVILFWFADQQIIDNIMDKFSLLKLGCKIITIWGPLPGCLPDKVEFPYILNIVPFRKANDLKEQLLAVFGTDCIDFVTAWEFAERYTKAIGSPEVGNDRFLTILQSLVIWINAKNLGVACGNEIPQSIRTYINILRTFFNIDVEYLLNK